MMELNISIPEDIDFIEDVEIDSPFAAYMQSLKMLFASEEGEICCASDMFIELEYFVYDTSMDEDDLKDKILEIIYKFCPLASVFRTTIKIMFGKGEVRDTCIIDLNVEDNTGTSKGFGVFIK